MVVSAPAEDRASIVVVRLIAVLALVGAWSLAASMTSFGYAQPALSVILPIPPEGEPYLFAASVVVGWVLFEWAARSST